MLAANALLAVAVGLVLTATAGCANCRMPRIDPSGERVLIWDSPTTTPPAGAASNAAATVPGTIPPAAGAVAPTVAAPGTTAAGAPALVGPAPGVPPGSAEAPKGKHSWSPVELQVAPGAAVAQVGTEAILLAGVRGGDDYLRTNERVEWSIVPGSVGEFVDYDKGSICDVFWGDFTCPKKISNTFVVGSTSRSTLRLTRGTPVIDDDVMVYSGQTWVTVSSRSEGTTYVSAFAPSVENWNFRKRTAVIHWIDANWQFPTPAVAPAGTRQTLTTHISRRTDQAPAAGWHVLYTVTGGAAAGFAPSGATSVEVETNSAGNATVEVVQTQPASGVTQVAVQILRTVPSAAGTATRLPIINGATSVSWSAPGLTVRKTGPAMAAVGSTITYRVEASNAGGAAAESVVITDEIPDGASYVSSAPAGELVGKTIQWPIGRLGPGECRYVEVNLRAEQIGTLTSYAEATAAGGLRSRIGATTTVAATMPAPAAGSPAAAPAGGAAAPPGTTFAPGVSLPPAGQSGDLRVAVTGPQKATVGEIVKFQIVLTNAGRTPLTGIVLSDALAPGLHHPKAVNNSIRRSLPETIEPGQTTLPIDVELTVQSAGRLSHTVTATAANGARGSETAYLFAEERMAGAPGAAAGKVLLVVKSTPASPVVGGTVDLYIEATNTGTQTISNVVVRSHFAPALFPVRATKDEDYGKEGDDIVAWRIKQLVPNRPENITIRCECRQATAQARVLVSVNSAEGLLKQETQYVEVRDANEVRPAGLQVQITTLSEPVRVNDRFTYYIQIANTGTSEVRDVALAVTVPPELTIDPISTRGESQWTVDETDNIVRFSGLQQVAPREKVTYAVGVKATRAGSVVVKAKATSGSLAEPASAEWKTSIIEANSP